MITIFIKISSIMPYFNLVVELEIIFFIFIINLIIYLLKLRLINLD